MKRLRLAPILVLLLLSELPGSAVAQADDAAYCAKLAALVSKYVGGGGGDGNSSPGLNARGAMDDCRKGDYARGIPYLEKRLRDNHVSLPPR